MGASGVDCAHEPLESCVDFVGAQMNDEQEVHYYKRVTPSLIRAERNGWLVTCALAFVAGVIVAAALLS